MASIYSEILQYEETGGDMVEKLLAMNVGGIFAPLIEHYKEDRAKFNKVLFYILHAYSYKSKFHILGADWLQIKNNIAERVGIIGDVEMYKEVVELGSSAVVQAVQDYLNYQGKRNFKHLCMIKDLYEQMVSSAVDSISKGSNKQIDYEQKLKNHDYATKLLEEISEWEQRVADETKGLKDAMSELPHKKSNKLSLRMEDNL